MRNLITIILIFILSKNYSQSNIEDKDYDGNIYKTEDLGGIIITTSNLNVTHFNNGDKIFEVNSIKSLNEATKNSLPAYCHFKFDKTKTTLYNWYAVNDKRGLLPKGYVLPSLELISKLYNKLRQNPNNNVFSIPIDGIVYSSQGNLFMENVNNFWLSENCDEINSPSARDFNDSFQSSCSLKNNFLPIKFVKINDDKISDDYNLSKEILIGHSAKVTFVKFSKSGKYIASGEGGEEAITKLIKIWDVSSGNCIQTINGGNGDITSIDFSPDESKIVTGSTDKSIKIWNILQGRLIKQYQNLHSAYIKSVEYNNSGDRIVSSGGNDGTIIIWNANTGEFIYKINVSKEEISGAIFSPDDKYIVCGNSHIGDKTLKIYNSLSGELFKTYAIDDYINSIDFSKDGKKIIVGGYEVNIIDFETGKNLKKASALSSWGSGDVKFGEKDYVIEGSNGSLIIRDISNDKILRNINTNVQAGYFYSFDISPNGKLAVIGTKEKEVKLFKLGINKDVTGKQPVGVSDFGISKITFEYTGNNKNKKLPQLNINMDKIISSIGYAYSNFVNSVDLNNTELVKKEEFRMLGLLSKKLNIEKQQIISMFFEDSKNNNKSIIDIYRIILDSRFKGENNFKNTTLFTTLPLKIVSYETVSEEEKKQNLISWKKAEEIKDNKNKGVKNYCFITYEGKYKISLFNDGSYNASYKLYSLTGQLKKTVSAKWTLKDEGVYGSAYILYINFTGANSNLGSMKYTCQYDAGGSLQAIIDNKDRTWETCY